MRTGTVIPSMVDGGQWSSAFGLSWTHAMLYDQAQSQRMIRQGGQYLRKVAGTMGVADARSEIVQLFLASDAEWLFMIDTDMGFEPDTVDRMVESAEENQVKVLGGLAFALKTDPRRPETSLHARRAGMVPTLYRFVQLPKEQGFLTMHDYVPDAFQFVDATGAACLLMHREALEAVGPNPFRQLVVAGANPDGSDRIFSEDLSFCARLANADISIGVDTSIKTTHDKGGIFLDEESYRIQRAIRRASPIGIQAEPDLKSKILKLRDEIKGYDNGRGEGAYFAEELEGLLR